MPGTLHEGQLYSYAFGRRRVLYRAAGPDRIEGFAVNLAWVNDLRNRLARELAPANAAQQDIVLYGGAIALVLFILSAGVVLLMRDLSREARTNQLRSDFVSGVTHELKTDYAHEALRRAAAMRRSQKPCASSRISCSST